MDQLGPKIKQITGELRDYIETRIDLFSLNVGEQVSQWIGLSTQKIIGFTIIGCGLFFAMIALSIYLGELLENYALGFLVVSIPLLLLGLIFSFSKPFGIATTVQKQIMSGVLKTIEKEKEEKRLELPEPKEQVKKHE